MKLEDRNSFGDLKTYEVVNEFLDGYVVWNIGRKNFPHKGYIPLCVVDDKYHVDLSNLKALYVGEKFALLIMKEAGRHSVTKKMFEQIVKKGKV